MQVIFATLPFAEGEGKRETVFASVRKERWERLSVPGEKKRKCYRFM